MRDVGDHDGGSGIEIGRDVTTRVVKMVAAIVAKEGGKEGGGRKTWSSMMLPFSSVKPDTMGT